MYTFVLIVHVLACLLLMAVVLMQSGRGGGLTEAFAAAESVFGPKTNVLLVRATTIIGIVFLVTSLSLAYLSAQRDKSLLLADREVEQTIDPDKLFDEASKNAQTIEINAAVPADDVREQPVAQ
ncbi:MAG TPA: preprotein translocase subunit SecG [Candidatus Omnitrophota bacterium]|nr:preprotein translocase subunit SecG [Candidatus Omnitrophota bacterium]HQL40894.1 preprotein translocase subunit SecG [Candidatus Omnitrophota bacterium]